VGPCYTIAVPYISALPFRLNSRSGAMIKNFHEIRDPIHVFIRLDSDERRVLDSRPFQRLRCIHQLALTHLVYPGATHKRFEHSLGVMELAGRVFDVLTRPENIHCGIEDVLPEISNRERLGYWKNVLRMAALCHDVGHLPFSHAAEKDLLPEGWDHERMTREIILSEEMKAIWEGVTPPLRPLDVVKLAIGPKEAPDLEFTNWEALLSEIIVGDAFGVDRMDYLLRDSCHAGVAYGKFDHYRLIDTLRILPPPPMGNEGAGSTEPHLGVEEGGLHSAEALLLARYFMYLQVYFHPVRRIYDIHLKDFLKDWLEGGKFSIEVEKHLDVTDNEVMYELRRACKNVAVAGHEHAARIIGRKHFKVLYSRNPNDIAINPEARKAVYAAAKEKFGEEKVREDQYPPKGGISSFPVQNRDGRVVDSLSISQTLPNLPLGSVDFVFIAPELREEAASWLEKHRQEIIAVKQGEE
jgi:uncharacterized protein